MSITTEYKNGDLVYKIRVAKRCPHTHKCLQKQKSNIPTLKEAQKLERQIQDELVRSLHDRYQKGDEWWNLVEAWYEDTYRRFNNGLLSIQRTTIDEAYDSLRKHTYCWKKVPASDITPADIKEMIHRFRMDEELSFSRIKAIKSAINNVFTWGLDTKKLRGIDRSPAFGVQIGSRKLERVKSVLNTSQITKLLYEARAQGHPYYHIWAMAALTGCRSGELIALRWSNVDFELRRIMIEASFSSRTKAIKSTKSGLWREVPFNADLEKILLEIRGGRQQEEFVLPQLKTWIRGEASKELRMFLNQINLPEIRFHDLRASWATNLLKLGVSVPNLMKIGGWADLKTMQHYLRLAGVEIDGATNDLKLLPEGIPVLTLKRSNSGG